MERIESVRGKDGKEIKIIYTSWGVANNYGEEIEINKDLLNYPNLFSPILKHELEHEPGNFSMNDFKHDLRPIKLNYRELTGFMLTHPKAWTQLSPIIFHKKYGVVYDVSLLIMYLIGFIFITLLFKVLWSLI